MRIVALLLALGDSLEQLREQVDTQGHLQELVDNLEHQLGDNLEHQMGDNLEHHHWAEEGRVGIRGPGQAGGETNTTGHY